MRDCIFLLADKNMEATFLGFLTREKFHLSLGIHQFKFEINEDLIVDESGSDPGVFTRAHEFLRLYQRTHHHAVIVLDNDWEGSPGVNAIEERISSNMLKSGWKDNNFAVIVISPELEAWILQDSPVVATAFKYKQDVPLRQWLEKKGLWQSSSAKPNDPKKAVEETLKISKTPRSSAIYRQITSRVSVKGC
ncbi:methylation-associated defense system protein MAD4 [Scytonema sp. NUACC26]|uniref:methylation-associated defense system protein MAD4 n=1 Tax=Scytonema sp. NUACC26 TaxID=3140176 RepID=UPI0034DBE331